MTVLGFWRVCNNHENFEWFFDRQVQFSTVFGTNFREADLTDATFHDATLAGTSFAQSTLTRTNFRDTHSLERAWINGVRWRNTAMRDLLVTGRGEERKFNGDLRGLYLACANLQQADLSHADLTGATLAGANLRDANLAEAQGLGTNFENANLTGAILRDWNIDKSTCLVGVECFYFYVSEKKDAGSRRPHDESKALHPGDFEKLFNRVQNQIEYLIRHGVDRVAVEQALQELMAQYPETSGSIRSVEKTADGDLILRMQVPTGTDAAGVEQALDRSLSSHTAQLDRATVSIPGPDATLVALQPPVMSGHKARIFISYAHKDGKFLASALDQLAALERNGMAVIWYDRQIPGGDIWSAAIDDRINHADIILLMITAAFIASEYCYKRELGIALARRPQATVLPIIVDYCDWHALPLAGLQAVPRDGKVARESSNRWLEVVRELRRIIVSRQGATVGSGS